jgi:hypothetical protein
MWESSMTQIGLLIAFALSLATGVATMGFGAFLLRYSVKDAADLASVLPTRPIKEDTNEVRESNRRKALNEILLLLAIRSAPGSAVVIFGAGFLIWICCRFLTIFRV